MASAGRRTDAALVNRLVREASRFDFFQAVRVLEFHARRQAGGDASARRLSVGQGGPPERELVRFKAHTSLSFPAGSVAHVKLGGPNDELPPEMTVTFLGLTGPAGVLPVHYTSLVIDRVRQKDTALREFLDLFNHRVISLFYRAWEKYRFPFGYERHVLDRFPSAEDGDSDHLELELSAAAADIKDDAFTRVLYSLVGLGLPTLRGRLAVDDEAILFYAGLYAHRPPCAISLACELEDYFGLPVSIDQFQGQWLQLSEEDRSRTGGDGTGANWNNRLGMDVIVGERVWDVQAKFRVRLGPLSYSEFCRFMPVGDALAPLADLVRLYVGPEFDWDAQPVLRADEVPPCRLAPGDAAFRLGWNTWLGGRFERDVGDAVFSWS